MIVFRVEELRPNKMHPNIMSGAYNPGDYNGKWTYPGNFNSLGGMMLGDVHCVQRQPMWWDDCALNVSLSNKSFNRDKKSWAFCFTSPNLYRRWFNDEEGRRKALPYGRLAVYSVPDELVARGDTQAIAQAASMELVDVLPLTYEGNGYEY